MDYALMFDVLEGGVSEPIQWNKDTLQPNKSIIVLDESSLSLYLWHGTSQGLVARRTALRQAESLKGHGYTIGKSIIGRDIKELKEIDARKVGKVPEDTKFNEELQELLNRKFNQLENFIVTFGEVEEIKPTPKPKPEPKVEVKPKVEPKVEPKIEPKVVTKPEVKKVEAKTPRLETPVEIKKELPSDLATEAKIAFVLIAITDQFKDIWVSKKDDGSYAVEYMDGPICSFKISESKVVFTANSFKGINPDIKTAIQKKFVELNKLL